MNSEPKRDMLLTAARIVLIISIAITAIAAVALAVASPFFLLSKAAIVANLAEDGIVAPDALFPVGALAMLCIAGLLALGSWFFILLRRIVNSVGEGDPFNPQNAERLSMMGWIALGGQLAAIPVGAVTFWIAGIVQDSDHVQVDGDFGLGGGGILLILVLFILARVFRTGTEMREDLEGTV